MPAEKRNNFLDADESDDDVGGGYESDDNLRKGSAPSAKRRKVDNASEDDFSDEDGHALDDDQSLDGNEEDDDEEDEEENEEGDSSAAKKSTASQKSLSTELPGISRPLTKKNLVATEAAVKKSGVVYLSRIPPFMKPQKLRSLLEPYGTINRIFLSPEDPLEHSRRVRNGGNKKRSYTDGWVEFVKKKDAKKAVDLLNARTIGGKKGSYYRDDIWNLLYLKGFKWHNLTEQISAESAERTSRMRAEISRTTKQNKDFVHNVEKAKMLDGIQTKAAAKNKEGGKADGAESKSRRKFEQSSVVKKRADKLPEDSQRVASMLFS